MNAKAESEFLRKLKHAFGLFNLTPFERQIIAELRTRLPDDLSSILVSQLSEFNQTDRLVGKKRGEYPAFGHTSFYKNILGRSSRNFRTKFPTEKDSQLLATMDVVETDNVIRVEIVLVQGVLFSMKYRSPTRRYVPSGDYSIENFVLYPL